MRRKPIPCIGLLSFILGTMLSLPEIYAGIDFQKAYSLIVSTQIGPQSIIVLNNTGVNNTSNYPIIGSNNMMRPTNAPAFIRPNPKININLSATTVPSK